jgi:peroxidase
MLIISLSSIKTNQLTNKNSPFTDLFPRAAQLEKYLIKYKERQKPNNRYPFKNTPMSRKTILLTATCSIIFSVACITVVAQQRKFIEGLPFIYTPRAKNNHSSGAHAPYRSYDGTNNNIDAQKSDWGATYIPLFRELSPQFGTSDPNNAIAGATRPSPRQISNAVVDEPVTTFNSRGLSAFVYVWGQFIDHDMSLTPTDTIESVPIALPTDEKVFTQPIPFSRSQIYPGSGVTSPRDEINLNTAWIDASQVYGTDSVRARWMRTFSNGKLKTSAGNFLAYNTLSGELSSAIDMNAPSMANDGDHTTKTFVAGDVRAAEHPGILSLHTLFLREHNKISDRLLSEGFKNDEEIYQRARKEVGAIIEAITYQEFLPALGVVLSPYSGYRPSVRPDIANTFATAAYRIGHTMVADDILLRDNNCVDVGPGELDLASAFWNPQLVVQYTIDPFLKGLAAHTQYETDIKINSDLRNLLFGSPNSSVRFGIDLASLNIQRGRDHGLPDYNTVRNYYTGSKAKDFSQVTSNAVLADSLKKLYGTVDNMDLWVGALAEDRLPGKSIGNTMFRMLKAQFENLRDGDFYFYLNDPYLSSKVLAKVNQTKLSDIIKRNTTLTNIQGNVFFTMACPGDSSSGVADSISTNGDIPISFPRLFPNPASNVVNIDLGPGTTASSLIKVFNSNGIPMKTINVPAHQEFIQVDISKFQFGTYVINVITGGNVKSVKLVKLPG